MRIKDPFTEPEEPFNFIPLTDMVFNLLIFFMAATTFAQVERELGIQLPRATTFASLSSIPQEMVVNIDERGTPIVKRQTHTPQSLTDLLAPMARQNPNLRVIIRADERGTVKNFATVTDAVKRAGVGEAKIVYLSGAP